MAKNNYVNDIVYYERKDDKLVVYLSDNTRKIYQDSYNNEIRILNDMEQQYYDSIAAFVEVENKYTKVIKKHNKITIVLYIIAVIMLLLGGTSMIHGSLVGFIPFALSFAVCGLSNVSNNKAKDAVNDREPISRYLDIGDMVIEHKNKLNSKKGLSIIGNLNPKYLSIIEKNKYKIIPPININSVRDLAFEELEEMYNEVEQASKIIKMKRS